MGCDIHLAVEVKKNGQWERALPPEQARSPWLVEQAAKYGDSKEIDGMGRYYQTAVVNTWYDDRNYELFAILADVRNNGHIRPIAEPRGLPEDLSATVRALLDEDQPGHDENDIWLGEHSQSWLTLAELLAYDWQRRAQHDGVVTLSQFIERYTKHGDGLPVEVAEHPYETWCGWSSGPGIVIREAAEIIAALKNGGFKAPVGERTHVQDSWSTPVAAQCPEWTNRVMPALAALDPNPENVRIVFGFDS